MTTDAIRERLFRILVDEFGLAAPSVDANIREIGLDSIQVVDLIQLCHQEFGYRRPLSFYEGVESIPDLVIRIQSAVNG